MNRTLIIIGFLSFFVMIWYELDHIGTRLYQLSQSTTRASQSVSTMPTTAAGTGFTPPTAAGTTQAAMIYAIYTELNYMNTVLTEYVAKEHPELEKELDYAAFKSNIVMRRSNDNLGGVFDFQPLSELFDEHFEYLKTRYRKEHPGDHFVID